MQAAEECRGIAAVVCAAIFVEKADSRTAVNRLDEYDDLGVGCRFLGFFAFTEHAAEEARFFRGNSFALVRCLLNQEGVAFDVLTQDIQADAVEGERGAAPVAAVVAGDEQGVAFDSRQFVAAAFGDALGQRIFGLLLIDAQVLHEACEKGSFKIWIVGGRLPSGCIFVFVCVNFFHAFVGEKDVGRAVFALFDTDDEFIAFAGGIDATQADFVQEAAQAVLRDFGAVFGPLGFHLTDAGFFGFDVETVFLPECFQQRPNLCCT